MKPLQATKTVLALAPQASATTERTALIDTSNASYAKIFIPISAEANTNSTNVVVDLLHSDDTVVTNFVSLGTNLVDNTAAVVSVLNVNLIGKKKNLRVEVTPDTTTNGAVVVGSVIAELQMGTSPDESSSESAVNFA